MPILDALPIALLGEVTDPIDSRLGVFTADNFGADVGNGDTFLFGGVHRLKILLLDEGESRLCLGESDPLDDGVDICDVLDALFNVRRMNVDDAFRGNGISMFVLLLVTFLVACNDVARLNGIFDTKVFVFLGDVGSETITGIFPSDGSSIVNVPWRTNLSGVFIDPVDFCRFKEFFSSVLPDGCRDGLCFVNFDVNDGRIFFNDSALR